MIPGNAGDHGYFQVGGGDVTGGGSGGFRDGGGVVGRLGFVVRNPYLTPDQIDAPSPDKKYISVERAQEEDR